ncbi:hypothetical protein BAUCODRAFT_234614 [Baudoinia panamericana UAMH 10762]|uniref:Uncharacterized protein n=1 Tax=Baudoinia panamericana (strain UAMH 10762) TaxID=717646 RepID=M2N3F6_BAUPA|nr:uncharacterized protein BAUCODRAFT_234614 [Baudoinia panamericana UAMH 10762]EMC93260.1 hypothetical protein BAUCODRAFT_234614 [Baudoinia panamericana UAMH 10762]
MASLDPQPLPATQAKFVLKHSKASAVLHAIPPPKYATDVRTNSRQPLFNTRSKTTMAEEQNAPALWSSRPKRQLRDQLLKSALKQHGIRYHDRDSEERLQELVKRAERGLRKYSNCTYEELVQFVCDRKLKVSGTRRDSRERFSETLERRDDELLFPRFTQLPTELQSNICAFALIGIGALGAGPVRPPSYNHAYEIPRLAPVNGVLRAEVLSLYHRMNVF